MSRKISQAEARRTRKALQELQLKVRHQQTVWLSDYPGGVHIGSVTHETMSQLARVACLCGHAVVVKTDGSRLNFFACLPIAQI